MYSLVTVVVGFALFAGAASDERGGCSATDYAPDSIDVRSEPSATAKSLQSIPKEQIAFMREDAVATGNGDWLKVRTDQAEGWVTARDVVCRVPSLEARDTIAKSAGEVIQALKSENMAELAKSVHPVKGLRFSPYASVDAKKDVVLTSAQLGDALQSTARRVWGGDSGSGAPIRLTFARYFRRFVYDRDFAQAPQITYNGADHGTQQAWDRYPNAIVVNYHLPEKGEKLEEDLRLVFEQHNGKWYLSGIIHGGWTI